LAYSINCIDINNIRNHPLSHLETGNPAVLLIGYIYQHFNIEIIKVKAYWLGGLATTRDGDKLLDDDGNIVSKCKSDILIEFTTISGLKRIGVSVKTCAKPIPTNDQMFFTTAKAFCQLLQQNGIQCSEKAMVAMSMFCGDKGYRPIDLLTNIELQNRKSDPNRYYWEELPQETQGEWKNIFTIYQDKITLMGEHFCVVPSLIS